MSDSRYQLQLNSDYTPDDSCGFVTVAIYKYSPSYDELIDQMEKLGMVIPKKVELDKHYRIWNVPYFSEYQ